MTIETTSAFLGEHAELRASVEQFLVVANELPRVETERRVDLIEGVVAFIAETLLPHAMAEERLLYPVAARLLGRPDDSSTVAADRAAVRDLLEELVLADPADAGHLQELLYALYALLGAHMWREEGVYMDLVSNAPAGQVEQLLGEVES
jgi:iron-sulfur cluster repair protein YtfE (RIC family)